MWIWELSGCRGAAGGAPRRQLTRKRRPQAQKGVPFGDTFGSWRHNFPQCFFTCFCGALFPACGAFCDDFWRCFGRYLGSPGPLKIMPKCTTICIFMLWTFLVRSLFRDLLLEGVWDVFFRIWVPIGVPIGHPFCHFWQLFRPLHLEAFFWQAPGTRILWKWVFAGIGVGVCVCVGVPL